MQFGLHCSHEILTRLKTKRPVVKAKIHQFWYLERSLDEEDSSLQVLEPAVVTAKGRLRGSGLYATNRSVPGSQIVASSQDGEYLIKTPSQTS